MGVAPECDHFVGETVVQPGTLEPPCWGLAKPMSDDKFSAERVLELLGSVKYPGFPRDVVTLGMVAGVDVAGDAVRVRLRLPGGRAVPRELHAEMANALAPLGLRV